MHSLPVTCISPHEAILYTHGIRRAPSVSSGTQHTLPHIDQTLSYTRQPAADTRYSWIVLATTVISITATRYKSSDTSTPIEHTTTLSGTHFRHYNTPITNMSFLLRTTNLVRQRLFTTSTRARTAISVQDAAAAHMAATPGASVVPRLGRVARW